MTDFIAWPSRCHDTSFDFPIERLFGVRLCCYYPYLWLLQMYIYMLVLGIVSSRWERNYVEVNEHDKLFNCTFIYKLM